MATDDAPLSPVEQALVRAIVAALVRKTSEGDDTHTHPAAEADGPRHTSRHFPGRNGKCDHKSPTSVSKTRRPTTWSRWSVEWGWLHRRDAWLAHVDEERRRVFVKEQRDTAQRHARLCQALLSTATLPARELLNRANTLQFQTQLAAMSLPTLFALVSRMGYLAPALIASERLSLGLSTVSFEIDDVARNRLRQAEQFSEQVLSDPAATDLALSLLDRIGRSSLPEKTEPEPEIAEQVLAELSEDA